MKRRSVDLSVCGAAVALIAAAYLLRLWLLQVRDFDPDEFEHMHDAWLFAKGMFPYRDYFEVHPPWFYFLLWPLFHLFDVENGSAGAVAILFFARGCMWLVTGICLALTFRLGTLWRDRRVGCVSALFLANALMFVQTTLEIRPDVPATAFWLAAMIATTQGVRADDPAAGRTRGLFTLAGLLLGAATMCTQKVLYAAPGFGVALLWYILDPRSRGELRARLVGVLHVCVGFATPIALTFGYFAAHQAGAAFIDALLIKPLRWKVHFPPDSYVRQLVSQDPFVATLAVIGFARAGARMFRTPEFLRGDPVCVLSALALFAGAFRIGIPYQQYFDSLMPLGAVLGAGFFIEALDGLAGWLGNERPRRSWNFEAVATVVGFVLVLAWALSIARPDVGHATLYFGLWVVALAAASWSLRRQRVGWAAAVLLVVLSVYPLDEMRWVPFERDNTETLAEIRYVLDHSGPTDTCMDGFSGRGVFRPHAYYYYKLHREIRAMLSEDDRATLLLGLESGALTPKLIFFDEDLRNVSPSITSFLEAHYRPVGLGAIWRRTEDLVRPAGAATATWVPGGHGAPVSSTVKREAMDLLDVGHHEPSQGDQRVVLRRKRRSRSIRWCARDRDAGVLVQPTRRGEQCCLSRAAFLSSDHAIDTLHQSLAGIGKFPCKEELPFSIRAGSPHFVHGLEFPDVVHVDEARAALALTPVSVGGAPPDHSSER
jgi:4-amino-4-deoxy-L-arabinose transferase-like glycosyltransferase